LITTITEQINARMPRLGTDEKTAYPIDPEEKNAAYQDMYLAHCIALVALGFVECFPVNGAWSTMELL